MKTLLIILTVLFIFTGCQKEEIHKIRYVVNSSGGITSIVFPDKEIISNNFDSAFVIYELDSREYSLGFKLLHATEINEQSNVNVEIFIDGILRFERTINHKGCKTGNYLIKTKL